MLSVVWNAGGVLATDGLEWAMKEERGFRAFRGGNAANAAAQSDAPGARARMLVISTCPLQQQSRVAAAIPGPCTVYAEAQGVAATGRSRSGSSSIPQQDGELVTR